MFGLRFKLLICLGSLLGILITVTLVANSVLSRYSERMQSLLRNDFESAVACQNMKEAIEDIDLQVQKRVWGDVSADVNSIRPMEDDFEKQLEIQSGKADLPGEQEATDELRALWQKYKANLPYVFAVEHTDRERRDSYLVSLLPMSRDVRDSAQKLLDMNMSEVASGHGRARQMSAASKYAMHSLLVAGICVSMVIVALSGTLVLRPLRQLTDSAREIAGGNLELSVPVRSSDEVGRLAMAFNDMAAQLRVFKKNDHEKLVRIQRTTQLAIDSLPDAVVVIDPKGRIELTNETAKRLFSLNRELNVTELPTSWLADLHHRALTDLTPRHLAGYDGAIKVKDEGQEIFFLPKTYPILDEDKNLIGGLVVLADVTDLRQIDEMKNKLLAMVSHELKTPLTSMRMIMHLLAEQKIGQLNEKQRDLLSAAKDDSDRLHKIVENLIDMGRIESGKALMEIRPVDSGDIAATAVDANQAAFAAKQIDLVLETPDRAPAVMADPTRIGHVLQNLLSNALKYTAENGRVELSVEEASNGWVQFAVSDDGRGIPRQYVSRVFEKFFRVPGQTGDSGTGLGLAIVKDIVEAHGGRIWVESREGRGTTFRFVLPRASHAQQEVSHDSTELLA
jgi:signal transduction histidine kinase/HAMP domain-containing protein